MNSKDGTCCAGECRRMECIGVRSLNVIEPAPPDEDPVAYLVSQFMLSLTAIGEALAAGDVVVFSAKVCAVAERRICRACDTFVPSAAALAIAERTGQRPAVVEAVLRESSAVLGLLPHFMATIRSNVLVANGGLDESNADPRHGDCVLLPADCDQTAVSLAQALRQKTGAAVGVVIADSVVHPLRLGTTGCALAAAGLHAIADDRGRMDLFGRRMTVTTRAVADGIAATAALLMGESDECTPFAVVRGSGAAVLPLETPPEELCTTQEAAVPRDHCLYLASVLVPNPQTHEFLSKILPKDKL